MYEVVLQKREDEEADIKVTLWWSDIWKVSWRWYISCEFILFAAFILNVPMVTVYTWISICNSHFLLTMCTVQSPRQRHMIIKFTNNIWICYLKLILKHTTKKTTKLLTFISDQISSVLWNKHYMYVPITKQFTQGMKSDWYLFILLN